MPMIIKHAIRSLVAASGIFSLTRKLTENSIRILVYHKYYGPQKSSNGEITVDHFERHVRYLKENYHVYPLPELIERYKNGLPLKKPSAAITVDDGHLGFYKWAYPILKKYRIPATLYVVSSYVDKGDWLWFDKFHYLRRNAPNSLEFSTSELPGLVHQLTRTSVAECEEILKKLSKKLCCPLPIQPTEDYVLASWDQLKEMSQSGLVDIGAHTLNHQILSAVKPEVAWLELTQCRSEIQDRLGFEPKTFCFPNGLDSDYSPEHLDMIQKAGYICGVTSHFGFADADSNLFSLPRIGCSSDFFRYKKYLDGFEHFQRRMHL